MTRRLITGTVPALLVAAPFFLAGCGDIGTTAEAGSAGTSMAAVAPAGTYGNHALPGEPVIPMETLLEDYAHLAETTRANPDVTYYVRYLEGGEAHYGILEGETIRQLSSHYFDDPSPTGRTANLMDVRLLSPLDPDRVSKSLGVAVNTMRPQLADLPSEAHPRWFAKLPNTIVGTGEGIELPEEAGNLNYEAELVLVIGRPARHVSVEEAPNYIWGVTAGNDMSENSWYGEGAGREGPTRLISKGTESWGPMGPAIAVGLDYSDVRIIHRLNGEVTQDGTASQLVQTPAELVSYLSRYMTLLPGDIIWTGTVLFEEGARRAMQVGDEITVEVEGIGIVRNQIVPMGGTRWEDRW